MTQTEGRGAVSLWNTGSHSLYQGVMFRWRHFLMMPSSSGVVRTSQETSRRVPAFRRERAERCKACRSTRPPGLSVRELAAPNPRMGYPGIPHNQLGVTTVGAIRAAGGDVVPSPTKTNPYHATLSGLTPDQASQLFRPTIKNPNK
jgi:hypothetical protein